MKSDYEVLRESLVRDQLRFNHMMVQALTQEDRLHWLKLRDEKEKEIYALDRKMTIADEDSE